VLDLSLRVNGVAALRVVDASALPTWFQATPTRRLMAIAAPRTLFYKATTDPSQIAEPH